MTRIPPNAAVTDAIGMRPTAVARLDIAIVAGLNAAAVNVFDFAIAGAGGGRQQRQSDNESARFDPRHRALARRLVHYIARFSYSRTIRTVMSRCGLFM